MSQSMFYRKYMYIVKYYMYRSVLHLMDCSEIFVRHVGGVGMWGHCTVYLYATSLPCLAKSAHNPLKVWPNQPLCLQLENFNIFPTTNYPPWTMWPQQPMGYPEYALHGKRAEILRNHTKQLVLGEYRILSGTLGAIAFLSILQPQNRLYKSEFVLIKTYWLFFGSYVLFYHGWRVLISIFFNNF